MDWKFKYTELAPPIPPRSEWPKRFRQDPMTENTEVKGPRAGNTVATLQPLTRDHIEYRQVDVPSVLNEVPQKLKEVAANTVCIDCGAPTKPGTGSARCPQCWQDRVGTGDPNAAPQPSMNCPDIDECAPVLNAGPDLPKLDVHSEKMNEKFRQILVKETNRGPDLGWQESNKPNQSYLVDAAAQIPEEIPPTNLWSLRWRINQLEERVGQLEDKIARHNVNSAWKIL